MADKETEGFGAPKEYGSHHFSVTTPRGNNDAVEIREHFAINSDAPNENYEVLRVVLARRLWTQIRDHARRDFNARLKAKKESIGSFDIGKVKLDRLLGKELCVLAWAAEWASPDECEVISQRWLALREEERWWLYSKTAAEAGEADQRDKGWRKALYCMLSDGTNIHLTVQENAKRKQSQKPKTPEDSSTQLGLF